MRQAGGCCGPCCTLELPLTSSSVLSGVSAREGSRPQQAPSCAWGRLRSWQDHPEVQKTTDSCWHQAWSPGHAAGAEAPEDPREQYGASQVLTAGSPSPAQRRDAVHALAASSQCLGSPGPAPAHSPCRPHSPILEGKKKAPNTTREKTASSPHHPPTPTPTPAPAWA